MSFINVSVRSTKQVFDPGTRAGYWQFWVNDADDALVAGPKNSVNTSQIFEIEDSVTKDQIFTAYAVRLDDEFAELGPRASVIFTLGISLVILDVAGAVSVEQILTPDSPTPTPTTVKAY
jgi:hypothetical protein